MRFKEAGSPRRGAGRGRQGREGTEGERVLLAVRPKLPFVPGRVLVALVAGE